MLSSTYRAVVKYGISDSRVKADDKQDEFSILWCGCGDGTCAVPPVSVSNSSVKVQGSFGHGTWGRSGGVFSVYSESLNYRLLDNRDVQNGTDEYGEPIIAKGGLTFTYGGGGSVKITSVEDAAANGNHAAGYPVRVKTGRYCSEFAYRTASVGAFTFIDKMTVTQYLSGDTDVSSAMTGASPVAVTTLELVYDPVLPADASEPVVTALNVTGTQYSGTSATTQNWSFTAPDVECHDLTGDYTVSQLNWNGVSNILVKQEYTSEEGRKCRREIRYVGSMSTPVSKEERISCAYPWGEEVISETVNGDTTTYEFYTDPDKNGYSMLKKVTYPQGNRIAYEYNGEQEVVKQMEVNGTLTYFTTFEYEYDAAAGKRTTTSVRKAGDALISMSRSITLDERTGSRPDEEVRFDEEGRQYVTRTWHIQGADGPYDIRPLRVENPDGTQVRYSYYRSGVSETRITESGVFSGDALILGTRRINVSNADGVNVSSESWFIDSSGGINVKTSSTVNSCFDEFGRAGMTTYLDGSTVTRAYGCCGIARETDQNGVTTTYAYDAFKRLSHMERDGIVTLYTYDAAGNQLSVTVKGRNEGEITTSNTYDNGEISSSTDALGNVTVYSRSRAIDSDGNAVHAETVTNPDNSTRITVSVNGQQTAVTGTAVHEQTMSYGAGWRKIMPQDHTVHTDMLGREFKTVYADGTCAVNYYNYENRLVRSVTPGGIVTLYAYDALGRQITEAVDMNHNGEADAGDLVTSTAYSYEMQNGKVFSVTTQSRSQGAESAVTSVKKESIDGLESWQTDLNGLTTHTKLERLGNGKTRQTVTNPDGTQTVTESVNGRTLAIHQLPSDGAEGNVVTFEYDEFNRQIGTVESFGNDTVNTSGSTYDNNGNVLSQCFNGQNTIYEYDVMGRQTKVTAPGGVVTNTAYYPTGEVRRIDGAVYPVEYTYNARGLKTTMTTFKDASTPQVTTWTYDAKGDMIRKTYADGSSVNYAYDADGQLITRTWARGIVTTYTYDDAGRTTGYHYSDGTTPAVTFTYDFLDRMTSVTDAAGTRFFTYNPQKRLANESVPYIINGMLTYEYDNAGRRRALELRRGTTTLAQTEYTYDAGGRIASVGNDTDTLTYEYVPGTNLIASAAWRNAAVRTVNTYDQYKRLTNIAVNGNEVYGYTLNDANQRAASSLADGGKWNYAYDGMGQLVSAVKHDSANNQLADMHYVYDLIGNRTSASENSTVTTYASNLVNQYTAVNADVPAYDLDGNMTEYSEWTYTYNGENRLTAAENTAAGVRIEAEYDYMGRRFFKKVYSNNILTEYSLFVYDGFKQLVELDENANMLTAAYLWQPVGQEVVLQRNGEYFIVDGNKNIIQIRNEDGSVTDSYYYDPFGNVSHCGISENPFQFSSEFYDTETGLVYYNYRYYLPLLGRWLTRDPIEEEWGANLYVQVNNNPSMLYDRLGLLPLPATQIAKCVAKCVVKSAFVDKFLEMLSTAHLAGTVKNICEIELRLPKADEISQTFFYGINMTTQSFNCLKECLVDDWSLISKLLAKTIELKVEQKIISINSFKCDNKNSSVNLGLTYSTDIYFKYPYNRIGPFPQGNKSVVLRLGKIPWCRCCLVLQN